MSSREKLAKMADTVYPSAKSVLTHKLGCRAVAGETWQWRLYWSEGGCELTLYQPDEGPQEASSIEEALGWIGGECAVRLNPGTAKYVNNLPENERETLLAELEAGILGLEPFGDEQEAQEKQEAEFKYQAHCMRCGKPIAAVLVWGGVMCAECARA